MLTEEQIIHQRLYEHESVVNPSEPSISRCANDFMQFMHSLEAGEEVDLKKETLLQTLDEMRFLLERLPSIKECLVTDLNLFSDAQQDAASTIERLTKEKKELEVTVAESLNYLKEMNELEKQSLEVNKYEKQPTIQKNLEITTQRITHLDNEIMRLKKELSEDSEKLHNIYITFTKLKNEILGIEVNEDVEGNMEIEE